MFHIVIRAASKHRITVAIVFKKLPTRVESTLPSGQVLLAPPIVSIFGRHELLVVLVPKIIITRVTTIIPATIILNTVIFTSFNIYLGCLFLLHFWRVLLLLDLFGTFELKIDKCILDARQVGLLLQFKLVVRKFFLLLDQFHFL